MLLNFATVSGSRTAVDIDTEACTVDSVLALVAKELGLPRDRLKVVVKGQPLSEAVLRGLQEGDNLLAVVAPKPPPQELRELAEGGVGPEEDELDRFRLPASAPAWQRRLAAFLQHRLRLPEMALVLLFSLPARVWLGLVGWCVVARVAAAYSAGPLYMVTSVFVLITLNLGRRREGEASAYSIFNNFQRLPGQLTAEQLDEQVRRGQF